MRASERIRAVCPPWLVWFSSTSSSLATSDLPSRLLRSCTESEQRPRPRHLALLHRPSVQGSCTRLCVVVGARLCSFCVNQHSPIECDWDTAVYLFIGELHRLYTSLDIPLSYLPPATPRQPIPQALLVTPPQQTTSTRFSKTCTRVCATISLLYSSDTLPSYPLPSFPSSFPNASTVEALLRRLLFCSRSVLRCVQASEQLASEANDLLCCNSARSLIPVPA